jgi:hypothetical protein
MADIPECSWWRGKVTLVATFTRVTGAAVEKLSNYNAVIASRHAVHFRICQESIGAVIVAARAARAARAAVSQQLGRPGNESVEVASEPLASAELGQRSASNRQPLHRPDTTLPTNRQAEPGPPSGQPATGNPIDSG